MGIYYTARGLLDKVSRLQGEAKVVEAQGTAAERGARLREAIDGKTEGVVFAFPGDYEITEGDVELQGSTSLIAIGAESGKRCNLTGDAVLFNTSGNASGIKWNNSSNSAGWQNGSIPFVLTSNETSSGRLDYCEGGHYDDFGNWEGKTCNVTIGNGNVIGGAFGIDAAEMKGDIGTNNTFGSIFFGEGPEANQPIISGDIGPANTFGFGFCNSGSFTGTATGSEFTGDTASDLISRLGTGGAYINCVDSEGELFSTADRADKGVKVHGDDAGATRPPGFASVEWQGSVEPNNWLDNDTWVKLETGEF